MSDEYRVKEALGYWRTRGRAPMANPAGNRLTIAAETSERITLHALNGTVAFDGTKALLRACVERGWMMPEASARPIGNDV